MDYISTSVLHFKGYPHRVGSSRVNTFPVNGLRVPLSSGVNSIRTGINATRVAFRGSNGAERLFNACTGCYGAGGPLGFSVILSSVPPRDVIVTAPFSGSGRFCCGRGVGYVHTRN